MAAFLLWRQEVTALEPSDGISTPPGHGWPVRAMFPGWGQSENIVTPFGEKAGIVPVVRPLANFLLPDFFRFTELRFGYRVKKAFMLVAGLFSSNA